MIERTLKDALADIERQAEWISEHSDGDPAFVDQAADQIIDLLAEARAKVMFAALTVEGSEQGTRRMNQGWAHDVGRLVAALPGSTDSDDRVGMAIAEIERLTAERDEARMEWHHMRVERDRARAWVRALNMMIGEAMTRQALADDPREEP